MAQNNRSTIIPNSFQTPNLYIDQLMPLLTPQEWVVLSFATRHIFGWQDRIASRRANISLSMFKTWGKSGRGCGLGRNATSKALTALHAHGILVPVGKPDEKGQLYELTESADQINWDALHERAQKKDDLNTARTQTAREQKEGVLSDNIASGVLSDNIAGVLSDNIAGVLSDNTNQTQSIKPKTHTNVQPAAETSKGGKSRDDRLDHPAIVVYRSHAHLHVPIDWREEVVVQVGSEVEAVDLWEKIIHDWIGHGWNKQNIKGMLEAHAAGGLRTINKNGARGSRSAHKDADEMSAFRENNPGVDLGKILSGSGLGSGSET